MPAIPIPGTGGGATTDPKNVNPYFVENLNKQAVKVPGYSQSSFASFLKSIAGGGTLNPANTRQAGITSNGIITQYAITRAPSHALSPVSAQHPAISNSISASIKPFGGRKFLA
jgi:hypothetical protein